MEEFSCGLVFSQEIVKNYVEHLKYLKFSKDLEIIQQLKNGETGWQKKYDDYNWDELVLNGGLSSRYVFEPDTCFKKNSLPNLKMKNFVNHLHQIRGRSMETMCKGRASFKQQQPCIGRCMRQVMETTMLFQLKRVSLTAKKSRVTETV